MDTIQFGYHMTLDFYGCPLERLTDMSLCYRILDELPDILEMKKLSPPFVIDAGSNEADGGKDPGGISGYIVIAESHISVHTFAKRGFVSMDVYSCKEFNYKTAEDFLTEIFNPQDKEIHTIDRGTRYPTRNIY